MNPFFGFAATAMQDPGVRQAAGGVLGAGLNTLGGAARGIGRAGGHLAEGYYNNIAQPIFNKMGDIGNQYLPSWLSGAGSAARRGIYGLGKATVGAQGDQGIWDALNGRNMPQQQMGGMQQGGMAAMQGLGGTQGGMMNPEEAMQQAYMQQVQQPYNFDYRNMEQNLTNQYQNQLLPQLASRFAGTGNLDSSYFQRQAGGLQNDLLTRLGGLREAGQQQQGQLNQQRIAGMGNYLGNQQQLGLGARRLGLDQSIAQRDNAYRMLGLMGNYGQAQQGADIQQLMNALNQQGGLANLGMGMPYQQTHVGQGQSIGGQLMQPLMQAGGAAAKAGLNYMAPGLNL